MGPFLGLGLLLGLLVGPTEERALVITGTTVSAGFVRLEGKQLNLMGGTVNY